jgi:hypothetical protein
VTKLLLLLCSCGRRLSPSACLPPSQGMIARIFSTLRGDVPINSAVTSADVVIPSLDGFTIALPPDINRLGDASGRCNAHEIGRVDNMFAVR